jgi:hypothetical protein
MSETKINKYQFGLKNTEVAFYPPFCSQKGRLFMPIALNPFRPFSNQKMIYCLILVFPRFQPRLICLFFSRCIYKWLRMDKYNQFHHGYCRDQRYAMVIQYKYSTHSTSTRKTNVWRCVRGVSTYLLCLHN